MIRSTPRKDGAAAVAMQLHTITLERKISLRPYYFLSHDPKYSSQGWRSCSGSIIVAAAGAAALISVAFDPLPLESWSRVVLSRHFGTASVGRCSLDTGHSVVRTISLAILTIYWRAVDATKKFDFCTASASKKSLSYLCTTSQG